MAKENQPAVRRDATTVRRYDVVIIGGGIAGIAVAEMLSRLTDLKIQVLERAEQLGAGSSGRLEGWYHTGALYAGLQDPQTFLNCLNALEDLYNLYAPHPSCNLRLAETQGVSVPEVDASEAPAAERWLNPHPVYYILPLQHAPDFERTIRRPFNRFPFWQQQRSLLAHRLENSFLRYNWKDEDGFCKAPTIHHIEEGWPRSGREGLRMELGALQGGTDDHAQLDRFCRQYDGHGAEARYEYVQSLDCSMNTRHILRDLVASSLASERVDYTCGAVLEEVIAPYQRNVKGVVYREADGTRVHVKADAFIVAAGAAMGAFMQPGRFPLSKPVRTVQSAIVVVKPALATLNFVRMALDPAYHFNHFYHVIQQPGSPDDYSLLADSGYTDGKDASGSQSAGHIVEQAERYFGRDRFHRHEVYEYACLKTEFVSDEEEERHYSYWIEHEAGDNYLYVLPGKFSMFPSVALQTYRRLMEQGCLGHRTDAWPGWQEARRVLRHQRLAVSEAHRKKADAYVALPYPQSIITL